MHYREIKPTPTLQRFVECFWILDGGGSAAAPPERILPDGCVELILNFRDRFFQHVDGSRQVQPLNFIVGQMTGPILISPSGSVELLGIRFQPGGTRVFLSTPAHEITDEVVALADFSSRLERDLLAVCERHHTLRMRAGALDSYLCAQLANTNSDSQILDLAKTIVDQGGVISVDRLASDAGVSNRQLERRFLREVGLGPKLLARIVRFQEVFRAVEQCDAAWATVAVECGYYDQAHLIRDFNQFAQQTPAVLFASQTSLTESFTRKTRTSDFYNPAA